MRLRFAGAILIFTAPLDANARPVPSNPLQLPVTSSKRDFDLHQIPDFAAPSPLQEGMIAREEVGPEARLGVGLAPMKGRNIHSLMNERDLVPTDNPGVNFVIKFPG